MFFLIKWTTIFLIIGALWYGAGLLFNLRPEEISQVKQDATLAIDSGDTSVLLESISSKVKNDLGQRKATLLERIRHKLKDGVDRMFDDK
jgi:hypothetical protein